MKLGRGMRLRCRRQLRQSGRSCDDKRSPSLRGLRTLSLGEEQLLRSVGAQGFAGIGVYLAGLTYSHVGTRNGFAMHTVVDQAQISLLPQEMPFESAAIMRCGAMTVIEGSIRYGQN